MGWLNRTIKFLAIALHIIYYSVVPIYGRTERRVNVTVDGSNEYTKCPSSPQGCSLMAAFRAVTNEERFKNFTTIHITPGRYTLNTSFTFQAIYSLTIAGNISSVRIQCSGNNSGLAFVRSVNISIRGVSLISCGILRESASYNKPLFHSALFVKESTDFKLQDVVIQKGLGIGVTIYDTAGHVIIDTVTFDDNGPKLMGCKYSGATKNTSTNFAKAGGGLHIEFTYGSNNLMQNSYYSVLRSTFKGNIAPYSELNITAFKRPGRDKHIGFSRGGGLSIYFRGSARKNTFLIDTCVFEENHAIWGGGYFIQFLDTAHWNNITIVNTTVMRNTACFGGGAFQLSIISSINQSNSQSIPNNMRSTECLFSNNSAASGGGGTIFGRTSLGNINDSYYFDNCIWEGNEATTGFALTLKLWDYDQGLFGPDSPFKVKLSNCQIIANNMRNFSIYGWGVGAVYDFLVPLVLRNVHFMNNTNTSLILDTSSVQIYDNVTFSGNTGYKGGAVAMYGEASFHLKKGSRLAFDGNLAEEVGGALFVETPGPDSLPVTTNNYLQTHECFFKYEDLTVHPDEWQADVIFIENKAPPASGYSVYTNSLRDCLHSNNGFAKVLEWKSFHYYYQNFSISTRSFEIVTDAIKIWSIKSDWNVSPAQSFSPNVTLLDEKNNSVYGIVRIEIRGKDPFTVKLGTPSPLFLVKDQIPFLDLKGKAGTNFSVDIRTVGGQYTQESLNNVWLKKCNPGFVQKGNECVCASIDRFPGISRCSQDKPVVYLKKGYWAGEEKGKNGEIQFVTSQCATGFCNCPQPDHYSLRADECVYIQDKICSGNREGVLCGSCKHGYSVQVGNQDCSASCHNSDLWRLAPLLIGLTLLVFLIFLINLDVFTCYLNVWLYFYQVVCLVIGVHEEISLDPFIEFVIGLAQVTISGWGSCLWKGMDNLSKLGFSYVLPVYVFIVVFIISLVARKVSDSYFARNSTFRASCTLLVLCYSTLASVSMAILRPAKVGDELVVFYQGTVAYFSSYHSYFAVPAILILLFIVVPFPLILMFTSFFTKCARMFVYATPLSNTFQSCFKDGYKWYAGFYFFSRFLFLLFATFIPYGGAKALVIQISCVLVLILHVHHRPYLEQYNWMNHVDSVLLSTLTVISVFAAQITNEISERGKHNIVTIVNALTYIPLLYAVLFGIIVLYKWLKPKLRPSLQNLPIVGHSNHEDPDENAVVRVV